MGNSSKHTWGFSESGIGDEPLHLRHGQGGVRLGIGTAVGDVDTRVAGQLREQQGPQRPERPLDGRLAPHRQLHPIRAIGTVVSA